MPTYQKIRNLVLAILAAICALIVVVPAWFTFAEWEDVLREAQRDTETLARAMEEHIGSTLGATALLLQDSADLLNAYGGVERIGQTRMQRVLAERVKRLPHVGVVHVYDDALQLYATSEDAGEPGTGGSSRDDLVALRDGASDTIRIGNSVTDPNSGAFAVTVASPLQRSDGSFGGVIDCAIPFAYFERFHRSLGLPSDAALALTRGDGTVLFRFPSARFKPGQSLAGTALFTEGARRASAGSMRFTFPGENEPRVVAYRTNPGFAFVVTVSRDVRALRAGWRQKAWPRAGLIIAALLCTLLLGFTLLRVVRERLQAESRHQATFDQAAVGIAHAAPDGRWLRVNQRLCDLLGYSRDGLLRLNARDVTYREDLESDLALLRRLLSGAVQSCSSEKRYVRKDGSLVWVNVTRSVVREDAGRPGYVVWVVEDIDARKTAETSLAEREARLSEAQRIARLGSWDLNLVTRRLVWSDEIYHVFEIDRERVEASYEVFLNRVHPDDRERVSKAYRASVDTRSTYDITHRLQMPDGRIKHVHERGQTHYDASAAPLRTIGTVQDVTEQVERERDMVVKDAAIESSINAIALADLEARLTYVNRAFAQLWGYASPADALARPAVDFWERIEDAQRVVQELRDRGSWFGEITARRADGSLRPFQVSAHMVRDQGGAPLCMMASFVDISQRVAAERALERLNAELESRVAERTRELAAQRNFSATVLDTISTLVIVLDREGRVVEFNRACEALTGWSFNEMRGQVVWAALIPPEQVEDVQGVFADLAERGIPSIHENDWLTRAGERRRIAWSNVTVDGEGGRPRYVIATGIDITERRLAERAILEAKDSAEKANAAKSEFLSRMSHELRTPLNAILGLVQVMAMESPPLARKQRATLDSIQRAGWHLLSLINDVLDLSRIEAGAEPVRLAPVDLALAIRECVEMASSVARDASVSIKVEALAAGTCWVMADGTRLKQVLGNLLSNAVKYNRPKGRVRVGVHPAQEGCVTVTIGDSGIGMGEDKLGRLFEPFNRLGAENLGIEGTGIGLVIAKRLVEAMGGRIAAASALGEGSTFTVELRTAEGNAPGTTKAAGKAERTAGVGPWRCVLYVEDSRENAELMRRIFEQRPGLKLLLARDGTEGLEFARRERPDLVILDMNLPGMDGHEVLRRMRATERLRDVPVVALSANAYEKDIARARAAGFAHYLTKPLRVDDFLSLLDALLVGARGTVG